MRKVTTIVVALLALTTLVIGTSYSAQPTGPQNTIQGRRLVGEGVPSKKIVGGSGGSTFLKKDDVQGGVKLKKDDFNKYGDYKIYNDDATPGDGKEWKDVMPEAIKPFEFKLDLCTASSGKMCRIKLSKEQLKTSSLALGGSASEKSNKSWLKMINSKGEEMFKVIQYKDEHGGVNFDINGLFRALTLYMTMVDFGMRSGVEVVMGFDEGGNPMCEVISLP